MSRATTREDGAMTRAVREGDRPTCATCPYWYDRWRDPNINEAQCRRYPPQWQGSNQNGWPRTYRRDFCGDHPAFPAFLVSSPSGDRHD